MSRNDEQANLVMLLVLGVAAVIGFIVWKFSALFGLDMATGGKLLMGLIALIVLVGLAIRSELFNLGDIAPAALAGLWLCFWPALTYWAAASSIVPAFARSDDDPTV